MTDAALMFLIGIGLGFLAERLYSTIAELYQISREKPD